MFLASAAETTTKDWVNKWLACTAEHEIYIFFEPDKIDYKFYVYVWCFLINKKKIEFDAQKYTYSKVKRKKVWKCL